MSTRDLSVTIVFLSLFYLSTTGQVYDEPQQATHRVSSAADTDVDPAKASAITNKGKGLAPQLGVLRCYECDTLTDGEKCNRLDANNTNTTRMSHCLAEESCMTKSFQFTVNGTQKKMWYMERNCTKHCEPYCITMGERTKIYACTSCCTNDLCNNGNGSPTPTRRNLSPIFWLSVTFSVVLLHRIPC